jgi:hypothetical protein
MLLCWGFQVSPETVKMVDRMWTMQQEEVGHILDELIKLLYERNGWKAALKQSQVDLLTMERKYVAQMRHRLVRNPQLDNRWCVSSA